MKSFVLALSAVALFSTAAVAGDVVRHKAVNFSDLNLNSQQGVVALHDRVIAAADEVCADNKDTTRAPMADDCRRAAVKNAMEDVGAKLTKRLTSIH